MNARTTERPANARPVNARLRRRVLVGAQVAVLAAICLVWVYPLLWIASASVKDALSIFAGGLDLVPDRWKFGNYARAWDEADFSRYMVNSVVVTVASVFLVVLRSATAGYVLARKDFPGRRLVLGVMVGTLFAPTGLFIIPIVETSDLLGLLNTRLGLILALSGAGQVAGTLLYMGYFSRLPRELEEAATVDGAGFLRTFFQVILPLSGPVTATVSVMTFLASWNSFFLPLVFTFSEPDQRTLAVGMLAFQGTNSTDWSGMAAATMLSLLPVIVVFALLQRYFIEGVAGAVKN